MPVPPALPLRHPTPLDAASGKASAPMVTPGSVSRLAGPPQPGRPSTLPLQSSSVALPHTSRVAAVRGTHTGAYAPVAAVKTHCVPPISHTPPCPVLHMKTPPSPPAGFSTLAKGGSSGRSLQFSSRPLHSSGAPGKAPASNGAQSPPRSTKPGGFSHDSTLQVAQSSPKPSPSTSRFHAMRGRPGPSSSSPLQSSSTALHRSGALGPMPTSVSLQSPASTTQRSFTGRRQKLRESLGSPAPSPSRSR